MGYFFLCAATIIETTNTAKAIIKYNASNKVIGHHLLSPEDLTAHPCAYFVVPE
jgi:hypothetical protein